MGRRNRPAGQVWVPESAARVRAGLVFGFDQLERDFAALSSELAPVVDDLLEDLDDPDPNLDDADRERLDQISEEAVTALDDYDANQALAASEAAAAAVAPVLWVAESAVAAVDGASTAITPAELLGLAAEGGLESGVLLLEKPGGSFPFTLHDEEGEPVADPVDFDVDGFFWWRLAYDDAWDEGAEVDESDGDSDDDSESADDDRDDILVFHILSRARNTRHALHSAWRLPVVADTAAFSMPWSQPIVVDPDAREDDELTLFVRLVTAIRDARRVVVEDRPLATVKQQYIKAGWPELPPLPTVTVVTA